MSDAAELETVRPESVGLCSERLARIDRHLEERYLEPGKIPGAVTAVLRRGRLAWLSAQGLRDRERELPMRTDTLFRIYSMTKPVTSVALMSLYEEGRFRLDDPVHRFIPSWRNLRVFQAGAGPGRFVTRPAERPMTIRHLLTHTSGLTYGFQERTNVDRAYRRLGVGRENPDATLSDMVELLAELPLEFSPGDHWNYSVSTDVVGHLVERIADEPLDAFLERRILGPLGMRDTGFSVPAGEEERFAACYGRGPDKRLVLQDDPRQSPYLKPPKFLSGGGGLVSTVGDYLRFCRMLVGGGELDGVRILGPRTLAYMTRNHLPGGRDLADMALGIFAEVAFRGVGFGLGFSVSLDPVEAGVVGTPGEFAWGGAASTLFWVDPAEELVVVFMTQLMPSRIYDFRGQLKTLVYGSVVA